MRMHESYVECGRLGAIARWKNRRPFDEVFWSKVNKRRPDECWNWIGSLAVKTGYGKYKRYGKTILAHRTAYQLAKGPIPDGLYVCHKCDNPPCCNPDHLFTGTARDNYNDAVQKGRLIGFKFGHRGFGGERERGPKLTQENVDEIRKTYSAKGITQKELACKFAIRQDHVSRIVNFKRWR